MTINQERYTLKLNEKGGIESLVSGGKEFVGSSLPLFGLRLRKGGETQLLSSDDAISVKIAQNGEVISLVYDFENLQIVSKP